MKIAVSYLNARQIMPENYKMVRLTYIFSSSVSIDYIMSELAIKDFSILEFSEICDDDTEGD